MFAPRIGNCTFTLRSCPSSKPGAAPITEVTGAALKKNVHLTGVQGVTDSEIKVAVITAGSNPLAGDYTTFQDGIQAYFNMINSQGGIYGRKLVISASEWIGQRELRYEILGEKKRVCHNRSGAVYRR